MNGWGYSLSQLFNTWIWNRRLKILVCLVFFISPSVWGAELVAHRAIYDLELVRGGGGADFTNAGGKMYLDWNDVCDGWTMTQHVRLFFSNANGPTMQNDFSFSSWESRSGKNFRYSMLSKTNGEVNERVEGKAHIDPVTGMGKATFTKPTKFEMELPVGTIFPTQHIFDTVDHALVGGHSLVRYVFSGTGDDSLNEVSAFISAGRGGVPYSESIDDDDTDADWQKNLDHWAISMGYFPFGGEDSRPEFEIHFEIFENGISPLMDLDYGTFAIRGTMKHVEFYPVPDC